MSCARRHACVALAALAVAARVDAGLTLDLRFADGSRQASPGSPLSLEVWAQVSGSDTDHTNDAFQSAYFSLVSQEISGDLFDGALASAAVISPFNGSSSQNGSAAGLTGDGVGDWGSTSNLAVAAYLRPRSSFNTVAGGTVGQAIDVHGWEFRVATT